ncbi:hypothetical protein GCHA_2617 [Paraglaciecola chathamensis S18K6]|uniref:Uncharacterized protein n=1 Tax=Paraglaciecola chathamensis S18K6 TaxID=1127672 RepID=A0AAV3V0J1_9ALTE|nr:hypothetical protein GCHA_2617 [Paraglaciecola chathamensis S18K6]
MPQGDLTEYFSLNSLNENSIDMQQEKVNATYLNTCFIGELNVAQGK